MSEYIRRNILGVVAIFIAFGGTAAALPGKNKVDSGDIKNANVRLGDLAANSVDATKVVDNSLKGADVDESSLDIPQQALPASLPPTGDAGGDLSGAYPDPQVQESGLIPGGDLGGTLSNAQVSESGLSVGGDLTGTAANAAIASNAIGAAESDGADDEITDGSVDAQDVENVQREIVIPVTELNPPQSGGNLPTMTLLSQGAAALLFDTNNQESVGFMERIPRDRVPGTDLLVDFLWSPSVTGAAGEQVVWFTSGFAAGVGDDIQQANASSQAPATNAGTANRVRVSTATISGAGKSNGDILRLSAARATSSADDDYPGDAQLHMVVIRYTAER